MSRPTVDLSKSDDEESETKERRVSPEEAEKFASMQQKHSDIVQMMHYQGSTLSRLVYDGVRIVFRRKKLGPKRPKKASNFMGAFGIATH